MIQAKADMEYLLNNLEMGEIVRNDLGAMRKSACVLDEPLGLDEPGAARDAAGGGG